jgi:kynureninase
VIAMNSLTVNLHLMMVSFYRPTRERYKILIEGGSFPSDQYALTSQIQYHAGALGFAADDALLEFKAKPNQDTPTTAEIIETIEKRGSEIALVLIGNVNYLSGQAFDMKAITQAAHRQGCLVGFDLAHGIGNLELHLHDCNVDFAVWCSYKYLNAGPGAIAGAFIHERHSKNPTVPRFAGWWGHQKKERFQMGSQFKPMETAEGWQLSNPPIFQCAALRASLELFDQAGMTELRKKSMLMTQYFFDVLEPLLLKNLKVMTPVNPQDRGSMLTLRLENGGRNVLEVLMEKGFLCDFREPNILRVTATPLYNKFTDVFYFVEALNRVL